jgi:hypothetical protein
VVRKKSGNDTIDELDELAAQIEAMAADKLSSGPADCPAAHAGRALEWAAKEARLRLARFKVLLATRELEALEARDKTS